MELKGKRVLLAGGARIGVAVAESLALKGCDVALVYRRSRGSAQETQARVRAAGRLSLLVKGDATRASDVKNIVRSVASAWGGIDIVINMVSIYERTPFKNLNEKTWDRSVDANLKSAFLLTQAAAGHLKKARGRIVHIADWVAASGRPRYKDFLPYYSSKAGLIGLTQAQALELAPRVLVNAIAPGPILPPPDITNEEVRNVKKVTPLGRWGGAGEIAKAVIFLCETEFVTGECLRVDGGRHLF